MLFPTIVTKIIPGASNKIPLARSISFALDKSYTELQDTCRRFAINELKPIAGQLDKESRFPTDQIAALGNLGLMGINVDSKYGGSGLDMLATCIAVEELSRGCSSTGIIVSIHNCLYVNLVNAHGTESQKEEFLSTYTHSKLGAFALSEHDAGSDVANMSTLARKDGDHFVLNGTKAWVTSGYESQAGVVFATIDKTQKHKGITAFLIPFNTTGVSLGRKEDKMGIRASSTCDIHLDEVRVHKNSILGNIGDGFSIAMTQLQTARIGVAAQALGIAQAALDLSISYAKQRNIFGKQLADFQLIKSKIAKMSVDLEAARLLTWKAAYLHKTGQDYRKISSMAKFAASRCATSNTHQCVQILGGMGYVSDMGAERLYRDARITEIYGGVTDVQKLLIAEHTYKEYD